MDVAFLTPLKSWLNDGSFSQKVLFAPSVMVGNQALRFAAAGGVNIVNTETATVAGYGLKFARGAPVLSERCAAPALRRMLTEYGFGTAPTPGESEAAHTLRKNLQGIGPIFCTAGDVITEDTAQQLWQQLRALEDAGLTPDALPDAEETQHILAAVWRSFTLFCDAEGYRTPAAALQSVKELPTGVKYAILGNTPLTVNEQRLLETVPYTLLPLPGPAEGVPKALLPGAVEQTHEASPKSCVAPQDVDSEIAAFLYELAQNGSRAEEAVAVCPSPAYALRVKEQCAKYGVPVTLACGVPLAQAPAAQLARALLRWHDVNYAADALDGVLATGRFSVNVEGKVSVSASAARRILQKAGIGWGADRWRAFADECRNAPERTSDDDKTSPDAAKAKSLADLMLDWIALFDAPPAPARAVAKRLTTLLRRSVAVHTAQYAAESSAAPEAVCALADELTAQDSGTTTAAVLLAAVNRAAETTRNDRLSDVPGTLFCCDYAGALFVNRRILRVLGMSWDNLNAVAPESPLLPDAVRIALSPFLPTAAETAIAPVFALRQLLCCRTDAEVTFSCPRAETPGDAPVLQSVLYSRWAAKLGEQRLSILSRPCLTAEDVALQGGIPISGKAADSKPSVSVSAPAETDASADANGIYKAYLSDFFEQFIFSPSSLERAVQCPCRFWLEAVAGLFRREAPPSPSNELWLDAAARGTFVHRVEELYYSTYVKSGKPAVFDEASFEAAFQTATVETEAAIPLPPAADKVTELDRIRAMALAGAKMGNWPVLACEFTYGKDTPLALKIGKHTVNLRGSIDRVDLIPPCSGESATPQKIAIIDYKTGSEERFRSHMVDKLQHYLYTLAWESTHKDCRVQAAYYLMLATGVAKAIAFPQDSIRRAMADKKIADTLDLLKDPVRCRTTAFDLLRLRAMTANKRPAKKDITQLHTDICAKCPYHNTICPEREEG